MEYIHRIFTIDILVEAIPSQHFRAQLGVIFHTIIMINCQPWGDPARAVYGNKPQNMHLSKKVTNFLIER